MDCPICKKTGINEETIKCPDCNSDLEAFHHLKAIEKSNKNKFIAIIILIVLLIAIILVWVFTALSDKETISKKENEQTIQLLKTENDQLKPKIINLEKQINDLKKQLQEKKQKVKETTYNVKQDETLFLIARRIYGNGFKYDKIASDNNIKNPDFIIVGQKLKIYY